MGKSNIGKHGIPVLAYLTPEPLSLPFSMRIQYHEARKQVTLMLRTPAAYLDGSGELAFVAQYDAQNVQAGTAIDAATIFVPPARRNEIERYPTSSSITTLTLSLKNPCPLWCPRLEALMPRPLPAAVESFNELVQFAKATRVHIVYDREWLSLEQQVPLRRLVKGKEALSGFPVSDYYARHYRCADWTVFGPLAEPPPPRRVRTASMPLPSPPPYKRANLRDVPSPTERATSPASPKSPSAATADRDETDFQTYAIGTVVQSRLPAIVEGLLPSIVDERLSALLPTLFALPTSFSSDISDSSSSETPQSSLARSSYPLNASTALPPHSVTHLHSLTPLGKSLLPHLLAHLTPQLSKLHSTALSRHVTYAASTHALELEETAQDLVAEIQQVSDEGVSELQRQAGYVLDEVREKGQDVGIEVAEKLEEELWETGEKVLGDVLRRLESRVESKARESSRSDCGCQFPCVTNSTRSSRATDVRMCWGRRGKGGYSNLGDRWKRTTVVNTRWK